MDRLVNVHLVLPVGIIPTGDLVVRLKQLLHDGGVEMVDITIPSLGIEPKRCKRAATKARRSMKFTPGSVAQVTVTRTPATKDPE